MAAVAAILRVGLLSRYACQFAQPRRAAKVATRPKADDCHDPQRQEQHYGGVALR